MNIELTIKNYRCFPDSNPAHISLRKGITALIGVNNSGKSSLLRFFFEFRELFSYLSKPEGRFVAALQSQPQTFQLASSVLDPAEVFSKSNNRNIEIEFILNAAQPPAVQSGLPIPDRVVLRIYKEPSIRYQVDLYVRGQMVGRNSGANLQGKKLNLGGGSVVDLEHFCNVFKVLSNTLYIGPFRNAINIGSNADYFDIAIGQAFIRAWRQYKTGHVVKDNEAAIKVSEDIRRIFGFDRLEIDASADEQTLQIFINDKSYKLPQVGSGLAQFILVLVNAATKQPSYILIDEPELNLHPSLQLDFLTTLASYSNEGILFGTHSIGLARSSADRVYSLHKIAEGESAVRILEATPRFSEFLGELSFSGYRELGFDKILLVEGRTDVKTVQQFLRRYSKDHKIVLLPLGGASLINDKAELQLEEIKRITQNVFALIDSERSAPNAALSPAREAFVAACKAAGVKYHVLERRAIENYLTDSAVKIIKGNKYSARGPYQKLEDVSPAWAKEENWRIAREMNKEELAGTDLGKFLETL